MRFSKSQWQHKTQDLKSRAFLMACAVGSLGLLSQPALATKATVKTSELIADRSEVMKGGVNKIIDNVSSTFSPFWLLIFSISSILGVASFFYAYRKFSEASKHDQDVQIDSLRRKAFAAMIVGVFGIAFSLVIIATTDAFGLSGSQGMQEGYRLGQDQIDGALIGY